MQCLFNEVDIFNTSPPGNIITLPFGLQTSVESHIEHTCGIIIDGLKQKDAGKWHCHIDFENEDTGQTENEVQEYTFKVADRPKSTSRKLCDVRSDNLGG